MRRELFRWMGGVLLGTVVVGCLAPPFLGDIGQWQWLAELERYGRPPGLVERRRDEGWGTTRYGRHGIAGVEDLEAVPDPKLAIWGDSLVAALQVPDEEKLAQQVTQLCKTRAGRVITGIGLGESGADAGDYYHLLPRYERLVSPAAHLILLSDFADLEPNGETFVDAPAFELRPREPPVSGEGEIALRRELARWHAELFYFPLKRVILDWRRGAFRFALGRTELTVEPPAGALPPPRDEAWAFVLTRLRERTALPLAILYAPAVPALVRGRVSIEDRYGPWAQRLREVAAARGIDFVDATPALIADYRATGQLPRGFQNGRPGEGHFNAGGHRALARAICPWIESKIDAVHAD